MRLLNRFLESIESSITVPEINILKINNKKFVVSEKMHFYLQNKKRLTYAGKYLGKDKGRFIPSSDFLQYLSSQKSNKVWVDQNTAWLFVCGKDVFQENILKTEPELILGNYYLVMYQNNCLGYGRFESSFSIRVIKNLFDIGDFLRREKS